MRNLFAFLTLVALTLAACGTFKDVAKTAYDIGLAACELFATEREQQLGMSPREFCAIADNARPFVQTILSVEQRAGIARTSGGEAQ